MRILIAAAALFLSACSSEEARSPQRPDRLPAGAYDGGGRDALCVTDAAGSQRGGFITYGAGNMNCSVSGTIQKQNVIWTLIPQGDAECRIPLSLNDGRIAIGPGTPSCGYYCGPGATFAGKSFGRMETARPVTDLAGDPLC